MTIPRDKYYQLKPFYDFQRQKEFNKDWCRAVVQKVCSLADGILGENEDSATELLWEHMNGYVFTDLVSKFKLDRAKKKAQKEIGIVLKKQKHGKTLH